MNSRKNFYLKIVGAVFLVALVAIGTAWALSYFAPKTDDPNKSQTSTQQDHMNKATHHVDSAAEQESLGNTQAAISEWENALESYQAAGDRAGEEGVKLQLEYLRGLNEEAMPHNGIEATEQPLTEGEE